MRRLRPLLLILTLMISIGYFARADDNTWTITERCFGDATQPPDDWSFDGTLLMTSEGRLHAFHQGWETPRIVVFSEEIPFGGALSPNKRWYAVVEYQRQDVDVGLGTVFHESEIHIFSTVNDDQYVIPWENTFSARHQLYGHKLRWLDNQHLLYSRGDYDETWFRINPFTQEVDFWVSNLDPSELVYELAPDATKALYTDVWVDYWILDRGEDEIQLSSVGFVGWSPDSTHYAAYTRETSQAAQFALFDTNGNLTEILFHLRDNTQIGFLSGNLWSSDGRHLLFAVDHLYIADMERQQIIDTCVPSNRVRSVAWSPDGTQFALLTSRRDDGIQIFDLQTWGRYVVGYHSGDLIGWRADD